MSHCTVFNRVAKSQLFKLNKDPDGKAQFNYDKVYFKKGASFGCYALKALPAKSKNHTNQQHI